MVLRHELKENHPVLEKIVSALYIPLELGPFLVYDILTLPARNWLIPRSVKQKLPFLSCREYVWGSNNPDCKPVQKYYHEWAFLFRFICRSYHAETCIRYKNK
jgi:hypothetical protein